MNGYDVIIIGAGIVGAAVARALARCDVRVLWIEKESDVCMGASNANSAIIHAGYDAKPGSLKAVMNVAGNTMWPALAEELDIAFVQSGSYAIAQNDKDMEAIRVLHRQGLNNAVRGLEVLSAEQMLRLEPRLNKTIAGALWAPTGGVIDPFGAVLGLAENAVANGVELLLETEFEKFIIENGRIAGVSTNKGDFKCQWVINCAGLYADEVMHKANARLDFQIQPRRGEYLVLDPMHVKCDKVLFPAPSDKGKGILVTTTTHGNVLVGPNSWFVNRKDNADVTAEGLGEIIQNARRLLPSLDFSKVIATYAGLRASGNLPTHDFIIERAENVEGLINLAGIESPGFAAAPAIAKRAVKLLAEKRPLAENKSFTPRRAKRTAFRDMSHEERAELVAKDPAYGRIVCRCENVTEGEIVDAIHGIIPARNYDAVKRRTWLGTGRCQGGFDYSRAIEILARELNVPVQQVTKKGCGSEFVYRLTKDVKVSCSR